MSFTSIGRILAFVLIAFGALRLIAGITAAVDGTPETAARYLGSATSGQAIDEALWVIGMGIALGVLTDISRAVKK